MGTSGPPPLAPSPSQAMILATGFRALIKQPGTPVTMTELAAATGLDQELVANDLAELARSGRVQRTPAGDLTGCLGLTLDPTSHAICANGAVRHTWCALDAFGIMGALRASGWIESENKLTGRTFHITVDEGLPSDADPSWVVFLLDRQGVSSVIAEWCPLVNIFESAAAAGSWADGQGVAGQCLSIADTASLGTALWEPRITIGTVS
jgi:alkylmercury lyase-like protein